MRLYALHPEQLIDLDLGGEHTFATGFLFVAFAANAPEELSGQELKRIGSVRARWRNRAKPRIVVLQCDLSDTFRDGCEVRTWPGGTRVSTWDRPMYDGAPTMAGERLGVLRGDEGTWRLEVDDAARLAPVRARLERYYRRRALRVLAGVGAPGP